MKFKIKLGLVLVFILCIFSLTSCKSSEKAVDNFPEMVSKLENYKLVGKLYSMFPSGTKESMVTVHYEKPDKYRVEINNEAMNDKQILLKNAQGTYVLVPGINKTFQIKSAWPQNSSYPYLLQSLSKDIISDEEPVITSDDKTMTIEVETKVFADATPSKEKIIFDKESGYPQEVLVYDENQNLLTRFVVMSVETNIDIADNVFDESSTLTSIRADYENIASEYIRDITYPTYYPAGSALKEEKIAGNELKTAIMKFAGGGSFTIVQEYIADTPVAKTAYIEGDVYVMGGIIGIVSDNIVVFLEQGVEYTIASTELSTLEMVKMGDSLLMETEK